MTLNHAEGEGILVVTTNIVHDGTHWSRDLELWLPRKITSTQKANGRVEEEHDGTHWGRDLEPTYRGITDIVHERERIPWDHDATRGLLNAPMSMFAKWEPYL